MAGTITSTNMALPIPVPGQEPGPQWATDIVNCLTIIDQHMHSPGYGVAITPAGLNINSDLSFQSNNLTLARSLRLVPYANSGAFAATASDLGCLYEITPELYFRDGAGNSVQITNNGFVNSGAGSISGLSGYPSASASYDGVQGSFVWQQAVSTAANMDAGTLILRYPGSYPTPSGNFVAIKAPTTLATGYSRTLPAAVPGANNSLLVLSTGGQESYVTVDNNTLEVSGTTLLVKTGGISNGQLAPLGQALSGSCGTFPITGSSPFVDVTNLSFGFTSSGRPVMLQLIPDATGTVAQLQALASGNLFIRILRDSTQVLDTVMSNPDPSGTLGMPPGCINTVDVVAAGTYTYKVQAKSTDANALISNCKLIAYEL